MAPRSRLVHAAKCCAHCRRHSILFIKRFLRAPLRQTYCRFMGQDVTPTAYCTRFRWAAGYRPPTPERPAEVPTVEALPPEEVTP